MWEWMMPKFFSHQPLMPVLVRSEGGRIWRDFNDLSRLFPASGAFRTKKYLSRYRIEVIPRPTCPGIQTYMRETRTFDRRGVASATVYDIRHERRCPTARPDCIELPERLTTSRSGPDQRRLVTHLARLHRERLATVISQLR